MASNAKTALVFMLLLATVMAAHANDKYVSCKNEYCKPITVNGLVIEAGAVLDVLVDAVGTIVIEVEGLLGGLVKETYYCPSDVTELAIVQVALGLAVKVLAGVTTTVGTLLGSILKVTLAICVNL